MRSYLECSLIRSRPTTCDSAGSRSSAMSLRSSCVRHHGVSPNVRDARVEKPQSGRALAPGTSAGHRCRARPAGSVAGIATHGIATGHNLGDPRSLPVGGAVLRSTSVTGPPLSVAAVAVHHGGQPTAATKRELCPVRTQQLDLIGEQAAHVVEGQIDHEYPRGVCDGPRGVAQHVGCRTGIHGDLSRRRAKLLDP